MLTWLSRAKWAHSPENWTDHPLKSCPAHSLHKEIFWRQYTNGELINDWNNYLLTRGGGRQAFMNGIENCKVHSEETRKFIWTQLSIRPLKRAQRMHGSSREENNDRHGWNSKDGGDLYNEAIYRSRVPSCRKREIRGQRASSSSFFSRGYIVAICIWKKKRKRGVAGRGWGRTR